jgi:site-specific DNA recombinase
MATETAAIYCRLSQDDGSVGESGSIQTQKTLLTQYCSDHHIAIGGYYCDDGWSGTNFDRPNFKRMLDDIESGNINMVIVKDLSRFGREYAQMGMYIEHYFEEKGVRFISVAENIDSKNGIDNLVLPFTNVINSFYARQASSKTKAAHRARAKAGMFIGSRAPFGYQKDPGDRHKLIIDPPAADVVREIFQMFADGIGYVRMTKILRERSILNPQAYFNQNNPDYYKNSDYWRKPFDWHATSIRAILNNRVYLGQTVFGRTKTKGFFDKTRIAAPEEEWVIAEDTHEPIITREIWVTVHQMMRAKRRENLSGEVQPFAGLVKCADYGSSLNVSYDAKKGRYTGFSCWVYKNYGKQRCTSHAIGWVTLNRLVLEDIRRNASAAKLATQKYMDMLIAARTDKKKQETERCKRELKAVDKRIGELSKILTKLYEDAALERISEERYQAMAPGYEREQELLKGQREKLVAEITRCEKIYDDIEKFLPIIWKYTDITELDAHILNELIEKIVVYEKTINPDGSKSQRVDIHYKFIGYVNQKEWFGTMPQPPAPSGTEHNAQDKQTA